MGSTVALVAFVLFIVAGFVIEAKGRKKVTYEAWLPLFWMVICASRSVGQWLNLSSYGYSTDYAVYMEASLQGSIVDQLVLSIVIIWGIIIIFKRRGAALQILKKNKALLAFTIYLGLTVLWSDISLVSLRRWIRFSGTIVMAAVLVTEPEPLESIRSIFRRAAYLLIPLSVMFVKYYPHLGILYTSTGAKIWAGVAVMKNGLGHLCVVFSLFLVWDAFTMWRRTAGIKFPRILYGEVIEIPKEFVQILFDLTILMMSLWLLLEPGHSASAASKGCLFAGLIILIGSKMPIIKKNFQLIGVFAVLAVCFFIVLESLFGIIEFTVTNLGRDMTLTDRVPLWHILLDFGLRKEFLGYGYEGFWIGDRSTILNLNQAHNGYLELFVEGGFVAIVLLGVLLLSVWRKIQRCELRDYEYAIFQLSYFAIILLANVTESSFARERDLLTFVFFTIALDYTSSRKNLKDGVKLDLYKEKRYGLSVVLKSCMLIGIGSNMFIKCMRWLIENHVAFGRCKKTKTSEQRAVSTFLTSS